MNRSFPIENFSFVEYIYADVAATEGCPWEFVLLLCLKALFFFFAGSHSWFIGVPTF